MRPGALTLLGACVWPVAVVAGVGLQAPDVLVLAAVLGLLVLAGLVGVLPLRHYLLGVFVASFAMFLLSRHLIDLFWPGTGSVDSGLVQWTPGLETHVLLCLNLALLGLGMGAVLVGHALALRDPGPHAIPASSAAERERADAVRISVRQVGLLLLAVTVPARLLYVIDTASFVRDVGFYEIYGTERTSSLPGPVVTLSQTSDVAVMAVLATRPGPRLTWLVLGLYFLDGLTTLTTLSRGILFLNTLLIVVYLIYRHTTRTPGELSLIHI